MGSREDEIAEIRAQIDESRENLGEAVAALAYKADVKNRAKEVIEDKRETIMEKVDELKSKVSGGDESPGIADKAKAKLPSGEDVRSKIPGSDAARRVGEEAPSKDEIKGGAQAVAEKASNKPLAVTAGAAAAGLVAGLVVPETQLEKEKLGPPAQNVREQVTERAKEAVEHAKQVAHDAKDSAIDAVKQTGQAEAESLSEVAHGGGEPGPAVVDTPAVDKPSPPT